MPLWLTFLIYYACFQALVVAMGVLCWQEGYFANTPAQAARREPKFRDDKRIGYLVKHGGILGDVLWMSAAMAFIAAAYGAGFDALSMLGLLVLAGLIGIPLLTQWAHESLAVPSGLGRDGYPTIAGGVHYFYMSIALMLVGKFYLLTPNLRVRDIWIVTGLLMGHVALGVLQPIYSSTGRIPKGTWVIFGSGWGALIVLASLRTLVALY